MGEQSRTKQELLQEIAGLKERIRNLEESEGEHKKAEAALRESEGRYHSLFEGSLDGVMLTRQDGTILAANRRMCEMLDLTEEEIIRQGRAGMMVDDERLRAALLERARTGKWQGELTARRSNGSTFPVDLSSNVFTATDGTEMTSLAMRDITERTQMEEALKENEEKYRSVFAAESDALLLVSQETGSVFDANDAACRLYGYNRDELRALTIIDTSAEPDETERAMKELAGRIQYRLHKKKDGTVFPVDISASFFVLKGRPVILGAVRDITDRVKAEERLRESEEKYRTLMDQASDAIIIADTGGVFLEVNRKVEDLLGYTKEELIGMEVIQVHPEEELPRIVSTFKAIVNGEADSCSDTRMLRKDGSIVPVDITGAAIDYCGKRLVQGIFRDITAQKRAEEEIRTLLAEKELLLREVHHRVKNNMSVVMSLLSLQSDMAPDDSPAAAALHDAVSRVQSMMLLYDKLYRSSDFRKISASEYLTSLVDGITASFSNGGSITVETHVDNAILDAKILSPIGIILNELVTNSMKHAFAGRESGRIDVSLSVTGSHIVLAVEDNGTGFPESMSVETSSGFGLQIVTALAEQIDARITLERRNGTRFVVEFEG